VNWLDRAIGAVSGGLAGLGTFTNRRSGTLPGFGTYTARQPGFSSGGDFGGSPFGTYAYRQPGAYAASQGGAINVFENWVAKDLQKNMASLPGTTPFGGGGPQATAVGGSWATLDNWNNDYNAAAAKTGTPANLLKAINMRESSGNWERDNYIAVIPGRIDPATGRPMRILPFMGLTEPVIREYGYTMEQVNGNRALQVEIAGRLLNKLAGQYGGYDNAIKVYFMGPAALTGNVADENGLESNYYYNQAVGHWKWLDQRSGQFGASPGLGTGGNISGGQQTLGKMFPGANISYEFDAPASTNLYTYGSQYGLSGNTHTGIDVGMAYGSPYYAPASGVVTCAGSYRGQGAYGGGCAAFGDDRGGAGRVEVLLDNGVVLIFGHSASSALQPGQRFNAGALLGTSGTAGSGPHIHLEARVRDNSTPSGWRIVDPRTVLGGGGFSTPFNPGFQSGTAPAGPFWGGSLSGIIDATNAWRS